MNSFKPKIDYTFYGDLLGIGNFYKLNPKVALNKLNEFYNETFNTLISLQNKDEDCRIELFSDSLTIVGSNVWKVLEDLGCLYSNLLEKDLFLRGGIVSGKLDYQPHFTDMHSLDKNRFKERLPKNDTLARAVGLEKTYKGSRFIIETDLAEQLFKHFPEWQTNEGYMRTTQSRPKNYQILKRISPTSDYKNYEFLYFWLPDLEKKEIDSSIKRLSKLSKMVNSSTEVHFRETIDLLKRTKNKMEM